MAASLRFWYVWLLGPLLFGGACQCATYSFQAAAAAYLPLATPTAPAVARPDAPAPLVPVVSAAPARAARPRRRAAAPAWQAPAPAKLAWLVARRLPGLVRRPAAQVAPAQEVLPGRPHSRGVAVLLAAVPMLLGFPLGLHNFYLGYIGRGIAAVLLLVAALTLLLLSAVGVFFGVFFGAATGYLVLFAIGLAIYYGLYIWQLIDIVRICNRTLQPRNGAYKPRFF